VTHPTAPNTRLSVDNSSEELVRDREVLQSLGESSSGGKLDPS
jgi:hypothetical protein